MPSQYEYSLLIEEIQRLRYRNLLLEKRIKELEERPEFVAVKWDTLHRTDRTRGVRDKYLDLTPGEKYIIEVVLSKNPYRMYRFETPMMLVETPQVIVHTSELHSLNADHLVVTKIENK